MTICVAAVGLGLLLGLARGGTVSNLRQLWFRFAPAGVAGGAGFLAAQLGVIDAPEMVLATALVALAVFAFANLHLHGMGVIGVGLCANLVPLALNGGTPVGADALVAAGLAAPETVAAYDPGPLQVLAGERTLLGFLGQQIPVAELELVVSFGDLVILVGLAVVAMNALLRRRRSRVPVQVILSQLEDAPDGPAPRPAVGVGVGVMRAPLPRRRERPVEVAPGHAVVIPLGWGTHCDDDAECGSDWSHPTMRLARR